MIHCGGGPGTCEECDGTGVDFAVFDTDTNEYTTYPCEECEGTGAA